MPCLELASGKGRSGGPSTLLPEGRIAIVSWAFAPARRCAPIPVVVLVGFSRRSPWRGPLIDGDDEAVYSPPYARFRKGQAKNC